MKNRMSKLSASSTSGRRLSEFNCYETHATVLPQRSSDVPDVLCSGHNVASYFKEKDIMSDLQHLSNAKVTLAAGFGAATL